jgi:hypothetical protein
MVGGVKVGQSQLVIIMLDKYALIDTRDMTSLLCKAVCGWPRVVDDNATFLLCLE